MQLGQNHSMCPGLGSARLPLTGSTRCTVRHTWQHFTAGQPLVYAMICRHFLFCDISLQLNTEKLIKNKLTNFSVLFVFRKSFEKSVGNCCLKFKLEICDTRWITAPRFSRCSNYAHCAPPPAHNALVPLQLGWKMHFPRMPACS